ncbi:hypothetical protein ACFLQL_03870 [Verrucomicrobiota bacterium]
MKTRVLCAVMMCAMTTVHAADKNRIAVLKTGKSVYVRSFFSERYDVLIKIAPGNGGQINFAEVSLPASDEARYPDQGMFYYHKTTDDTPPWIINDRYLGGNHGGVVIKRQEYLVDGKTPLREDMFIRCEFLDMVDEYDVVQKVKGKQEVLISNRIVYRLQPFGACTIEHHATVRRDCRINLWALTQAMVLGGCDFSSHYRYLPPEFDRHVYYIPKTLAFVKDGKRYDFSRLEDYRKAAVPIKFNVAMVGDTNNLPDRFMQLLGSGGKNQIGFVCGYSLITGCTRPEERARRCHCPIKLSKSQKTYPIVLDDMDAKAGTELHALAYRQYFDPAAFTNATAVYWHRQGGSHVVYLDYHQSVPRDVIQLPEHLVGKKITVVEKTPTVELLSGLRVPVEGIGLSVTDDYGYIVLQLDEQGDTNRFK